MFVLFGELKFWTFDSDVQIKDADFGVFSYHDKKIDNVYKEAKKSYAQKRGMVYVPQNKKGNKLKESIKYLEDQLDYYGSIFCKWSDYCNIQIMLSSGLLIYIQVDLSSGDIQKIVFDKYLIGKLCNSERLSDVLITKNYLVLTYNDAQVTFINFLKPKKSIFEKINRLDPKVSTFDLCAPSGRRLEKRIQCNRTEDLILIWWKSAMNEVFPWSPTVKEHDRANVHLYKVTGVKFELLCYLQTEFDPLGLVFHTNYDNVFHSLEQKVSRKGEVTVEWRTYEVSQHNRLQRISVVSVPLPTHASCVRFSPKQEMLLLCCIDGSINLHDQLKGINNTTKAAFIPTLACWHSDGNIFAVANERGQIQHFDIALNGVKSQMLSEDIAPANIVDLSSYFRSQPALVRLEWAKKNESNSFVEYYNHGDSLFLLMFERGPIAIMRIVEGDRLSGDILVQKYLELSQVQQAMLLLLAMNWDLNPNTCMHSLNQIINYLFKLPLTPDRESMIQNALGSFHVPVKPLSQSVIDEYGNEVRDLTRRFFHHLLRYRLFEKAFRLAIDLNDHDLFMDIHFYAIVLKDIEMATAAKERAEEIISRGNSSSSSHSTCSRPSCSLCSDSMSERDDSYSDDTASEEFPKKGKIHVKRTSKPKYSKNPHFLAPPLPVIYTPVYNNSGSVATSLKVADKVDSNIISTPFNLPNNNGNFISYPCSTSNYVPSTYSTGESCFFNVTNTPKYTQSNRSYDNLPPFQSLSISNQLISSVIDTSLKSMPSDNVAGTQEPKELSMNSNQMKLSEVLACSISSSVVNTTADIVATSFKNSLSNATMETQDNDCTSTELNKINTLLSGTSETQIEQSDSNCAVFISPKINVKDSPQSNDNPHPIFNLGTMQPTFNTAIPPIFNTGANFMSTSFNDVGDLNDNTNSNSYNSSSDSNSLIKKHSSSSASPIPPTLKSHSLSRYMHSPTIPKHTPSNLLPQQDLVSNILQNHFKQSNSTSNRKYGLDYELDHVQFYNSCDNVNKSSTQTSYVKSNSYNVSPKPFDYKFYKLGFSPNNACGNLSKDFRQSSNVPPLPVITSSNENYSSLPVTSIEATPNVSDKPKVKFSDTVTHILVPNSGPTYRPIQKRSISQLHPMDPKRELADSLPLCLGNEDYLKDFQPLSKGDCDIVKEPSKPEEPAKIKVVHFGLL